MLQSIFVGNNEIIFSLEKLLLVVPDQDCFVPKLKDLIKSVSFSNCCVIDENVRRVAVPLAAQSKCCAQQQVPRGGKLTKQVCSVVCYWAVRGGRDETHRIESGGEPFYSLAVIGYFVGVCTPWLLNFVGLCSTAAGSSGCCMRCLAGTACVIASNQHRI